MPGVDTGKIGMMDGAYFVSKTVLLQWLNAFLKTNYEKVEQVSLRSRGVQACVGEWVGAGASPGASLRGFGSVSLVSVRRSARGRAAGTDGAVPPCSPHALHLSTPSPCPAPISHGSTYPPPPPRHTFF